jgi:flagellar operon protein
MDAITKNLHGILQADNKRQIPQQNGLNAAPAVSFQDVLFSKHAALRLNDRSIALSSDQMDRVADAIVKADAKGIRDSLVLVDDVALVVNVKSRTVITAMNQDSRVISNIDGAVII